MRRLAAKQAPRWFFSVIALVFWVFGTAGAQQTGVIYGIRTLQNEFVIESVNLTDQGSRSQEMARFIRGPQERIQEIYQLQDRRIGLIVTSSNREDVNRRARVRLLGMPGAQLGARPGTDSPVSGLDQDDGVSSVAIANAGPSISLVGNYRDVPPFSIATFNPQTSQTTLQRNFELSPRLRYSNLTQCPNGILYGTELEAEDRLNLVRFDLAQRIAVKVVELRFMGKTLFNDLADLACSASNQLFALDDPTYQDTNSLFAVDIQTGELRLVRSFDVDKISFVKF